MFYKHCSGKRICVRYALTGLLTAVLIISLVNINLFSRTPPAVDSFKGKIAYRGKAKVIDGDTLRVGKHKIRLYGIDAPEIQQRCGEAGSEWFCGVASKRFLIQLIDGKKVLCTHEGISLDRVVGHCYVGGKDLEQEMVRAGYAFTYHRHSIKTLPFEEEAMHNKAGIWAGSFQRPREWRIRHCGQE